MQDYPNPTPSLQHVSAHCEGLDILTMTWGMFTEVSLWIQCIKQIKVNEYFCVCNLFSTSLLEASDFDEWMYGLETI